MAKRKKQGGPTFNPVSFNVGNIQRAMNEPEQVEDRAEENQQPSAEQLEAPAPPAPPAQPVAVATEPVAVEPLPQSVEPRLAEQPAPPAAPASAARPTRTPAKKRRPPVPAGKRKTLAAAVEARQNRDLYKQDYLRVFVDAQQRRDLGRFVMDLNDALDVRLPETIIYRALLSIMQSAKDHIIAAAEAGEPLPATPARQDPLQMAEAEYRVAQLVRDGILAAAGEDLDALYVGKLEVEEEPDARADQYAAA